MEMGNWVWNAVHGEGGASFLGKKKRSTSTKLHSDSLAEIGMRATSKYLNHGWVTTKERNIHPQTALAGVWPQPHPHPCTLGKGGWRERGKRDWERSGRCFHFWLSFSPPNLSVNYMIFPLVTSVLLMTAPAQWPHCLYLNPWAF